MAHSRLLTNYEHVIQGVSPCDLCPHCPEYPETVMHSLRDCEVLKNLWSRVVSEDELSKFFSLGLHAWLEFSLSLRGDISRHRSWILFFGLAVREIWLDRNQLVFDGDSAFLDSIWYTIRKPVNLVKMENSVIPSLLSSRITAGKSKFLG